MKKIALILPLFMFATIARADVPSTTCLTLVQDLQTAFEKDNQDMEDYKAFTAECATTNSLINEMRTVCQSPSQ